MKTISIFILLIYWSIMIFAPVMSKDIKFSRGKINNVKIIVKFSIIGVIAIEANLPIVFRYAPARDVKQTNKTNGKVNRDKSTAKENLSGFLVKPGAIKLTISGIKISTIRIMVRRTISSPEKILEKNSSDFFFPDFSEIPDITGIKAEFIEPSANSLLNKFGNLNAIKKASDISPAPKTLAIKRSRV